MLQPARPPFFLASGGLVGLGCEGNGWFSARLCRVGPSLSRFVSPGGERRVEVLLLWWNKVLRLLLHLAVASSGIGDKLVRSFASGSGGPVVASAPVSFCTGVVFRRAVWPAELVNTEWGLEYREVFGLLVAGWMDPCSSFAACRYEVWIHGRRSLGRVPNRCASMVFSCCGSPRSLWAMWLLLAWVALFPFPGAGVLDDGGGRRRRRPMITGCAKDLQYLIVISSFHRVFCAKWLGHLCFCILPEGACICTVPMYVFLNV